MTQSTKLACVILTAGQGKRMKSTLPKVLHPVAGRPMIQWLLASVDELAPDRVIVVTAPDAPGVADAVAPHQTAIQSVPRGTGDAVRAAMPALAGFDGDVLVLLGDMPLLSAAMMRDLIATRRHNDKTGLAVLGVEYATPPAFGRLVMNEDGTLKEIVEDKDATPEQRAIRLCNTGAFCIDGRKLPGWLDQLQTDNAQGEYYITDLPAIAAAEGIETRVSVLTNADEVAGVNSRADLSVVESIAQNRLRRAAMDNGATLVDPSSVFFSHDTVLGRDVVVGPHVVFGPGVVVGNDVRIESFSHIEGAQIASGCTVGPFARLRPGTVLDANVKIGNFVEVKKSHLRDGAKASHLAYIGDADVGAGVNFSCGAITANYDGFDKFKTVIGAGAMVGSNVTLVAPVEIGAGAYLAAGGTVTKDVPADALFVERAEPRLLSGWAAKFRAKKKKP